MKHRPYEHMFTLSPAEFSRVVLAKKQEKIEYFIFEDCMLWLWPTGAEPEKTRNKR